ncbi:hypothetical protein IFM89_021604 [Coptis chinensis]|uniref:GBF-interacting protein 1 N-terminal domain-containing protein n=1 Tax=Coptis chinensis TaxID=261450 RepID=A0A835IED8_9MAGN|nr:hypothetical protein IFM89_021604 [Coptis chinensis]
MVSGDSKEVENGLVVELTAENVRKTIESIKEIVGSHSEADIYAILQETNMNPNEAANKLLNQDPFHEVKRKKDKKKENTAVVKVPSEPKKLTEQAQGTNSNTVADRNARRGGYIRNSLPVLTDKFLLDAGISREFRVVRDNRLNQNTHMEKKPVSVQSSSTARVPVIEMFMVKGKCIVPMRTPIDQKHIGPRNSEGQRASITANGPSLLGPGQNHDAKSNITSRRGVSEESRAKVLNSTSQLQGPKPQSSQPSATLASINSVVGLYSSSSDPVHVPSNSRTSGTVGAIGIRRQSSENSTRHPTVPSNSLSAPVSRKDANSETLHPSSAVVKSDQLVQSSVSEPVVSSIPVGKSSVSNQYVGKPHQQLMGHQKALQPNKEWKPKSSKKSSFINSAVIATTANPHADPNDNSTNSKKEADHLQEKFSRVNVNEDEHVIIPLHLRVPEADRTQLTFGSFGLEFDSANNFSSGFQVLENQQQFTGEPSSSVSVPSASSEDVNQVDSLNGHVRNSGSASPASTAVSEHPSPGKKESPGSGNLESYADIGMVRNDSPSYTPAEPQQHQDPPGLSGFVAYDHQTGYEMPFFRPSMDESMRGQGVPSPGEAFNSHVANSIPASSVAMLQQQPVPQLYPQVHVSHFPNFMPYRQFLSPVYVPPMGVPGYSNNPAYPHPSNGNGYLLMPGGSSHLAPGGLKYGASQYKPIPAGTPTGFGSYSNPAGYTLNAQGTVGGATGLDDSTRMKYKDGNIYVPNPQAETSEIWIQTPRELPAGMQSGPYYNISGQPPHAQYMPSHTGHASFNTAATPQPTHMQFPGLYHPSPQPSAIANPHHMVPGVGSNVGVGVTGATPGAQLGGYQQPQIGHLNWNSGY